MVSLRKYNISPLTHQSGDGFIIWCRHQQIGEPPVWNRRSWESWESHDHLRAAELNVREQDHGKHSSFYFLYLQTTRTHPLKLHPNRLDFLWLLCTLKSWVGMNMCYFSELIRANRNQVSERVVGSAGLRGGDNRWGSGRGQAGGWLWCEKGKAGYRAPSRKCPGVSEGVGGGKQMWQNVKKCNIAFNLFKSCFNWQPQKSIFSDSETIWVMGWIMNEMNHVATFANSLEK